MQQAGQAPFLDQNDAHEQRLGQSDESLPGPEQTLNQSINQTSYCHFICVIGLQQNTYEKPASAWLHSLATKPQDCGASM